MANDLIVRVLGETSQFEKSLKTATQTTTAFDRTLKRSAITAEQSAQAQIAASVKKDARLREEITLYRQIASAAERGSREQVVAANLAERAERQLARSMGATAVEVRALSASTQNFERHLGGATRGALVGSGIFRSLGRAVAFSSTSFLGGAGAVFAIKATSQAASNMNEQVSKSRQVFGESSTEVERFAKDSLGLASDQAIEAASSFGALLRPMGILPGQAAQISTQMTQLGLDFSSFFNTDTADALQAIQSGLVGEVEPLRRYGVLLSAARVQQEALSETGKRSVKALTQQELVQARVAILFRDSAQAQGDFARTSGGLANQQRILQRNVRNLEIAIGTGLNPTILTTTKDLNAWLSQSENQARVQRDVTEAVAAGREVVHDFAAVVRAVDDVTGSFKNTLALLLALKVASWARGTAIGIGLIGAEAQTATGRVAGLRGGLLGLNAIAVAPIVIPVELKIANLERDFVTDKTGKLGKIAFDIAQAVAAGGTGHLGEDIAGLIRDKQKKQPTPKPFPDVGFRSADLSASAAITERAAAIVKGLTADQRNTFFDNEIARILLRGGLGNIQTQIDALVRADRLIEQRLKVTKDVTRRLNLEDELLSNQAQIRQLKAAQAADAAQAAEEAHQKLVDQLAKIADQRKSRQFVALGLSATGDERIPGVRALRRALGNVQEEIIGSSLDTKKTKSLLASIRRVLSGGLGAVGEEVRAKIQKILGDLNRQLDDSTTKNLTKWKHLSSQAFLAGVPDLTAAQRRQLELRLSTLGPGNSVPPRQTQAFALAGGRTTQSAATGDVYMDGERVGTITRSHQIRRSRKRTVPRSG